MPKLYSLLVLLSLSFSSFAQTPFLSGTVLDGKDDSSLPGAYVHLIYGADSTQQVTATDGAGAFSFPKVAPGRYVLKVTFIGYQPFSRTLEVKDQPLLLGKLKISADANQLREVVIEGRAAAAEVRGDTIAFNAMAYKMSANAGADQLVEKLPGVVMEDGKMQVQGETVTRVTVDGQMFFGDDAIAALRNLPAEVIDKIEVFERRSDQAEMTGIDDGERYKTINIVTKKHMRTGKFGRGRAGYGSDNRYAAGGSLNMFQGKRRVTVLAQTNNVNQQNFSPQDTEGLSGGAGNADDFNAGGRSGISQTNALGLNYADLWGPDMEVSGSYFYNRIANTTLRNLNRHYVLSGRAGQEYLESSNRNSIDRNHRFNLRLNYKITPKTTLRLTPRLNVQENEGFSAVSAETSRQDTLENSMRNRRNTDRAGLNFNNNLIVTHRFARPGRSVAVNLGTSFSNLDGGNVQYSESKSFVGAPSTDLVHQMATLNNGRYSLSSNVSLTERLGQKGIMLLDYNISYANSDSDQRTFAFDETLQLYSRMDTALSNTFNNQYLTNRIGPGYRFVTPKAHLVARAYYQTVSLDLDQVFPSTHDFGRSFQNVLPQAFFRYRFRQKQELSVNYRTFTNSPSANQLQDVVNNNNPLQLRTGNPDLDQTYQHRLDTRYSFAKPEASRVFNVSFSGLAINNTITNSTFITTQDSVISPTVTLPAGGQISRPVNLNGRYSMWGNMSYGFPVNPLKSKLNLNLWSNYNRTPGMVNNRMNVSNNTGLGIRVGLSSNISRDLDFNLSTRSGFNTVTNSLRPEINNQFFNQHTQARVRWVFWEGLILENDVNHRLNRGLAASFNQNFTLWNASIGKTLFPDQRGELKITGYDILNQNTSINRNVSDIFIQDVETNVLTRYFMLSFTYNFRSFSPGSEG